jgi:hypothetical protein
MKTLHLFLSGVLALGAVGCGEAPEQEPSTKSECERITSVLEDLRAKRGSCTPNYMNEEPFAFNPATCEANFASDCPEAYRPEVERYIDCLGAVATCNPAAQRGFDEAIDACLDHAQQVLDETCIERVIGD